MASSAFLNEKSVQFSNSGKLTGSDVYNVDPGPLAVSFFIKGDSTLEVDAVVSKRANPGRGWAIHLNGGKPRLILVNEDSGTKATTVEATISVLDGNWHHVVATWGSVGNAADCAMWIDGVSQSLTTLFNNLAGASISNTNILTIGDESSGSANLTGKLDEVSIWTAKIVQADVDAIRKFGKPADLTKHPGYNTYLGSWWRMGDLDDSIGGGILDRKGNVNLTVISATIVEDVP